MSSFNVRYTETIQYEITIEAETKDEAEQKIRPLDYEPEDATQLHISTVDIDNVREE